MNTMITQVLSSNSISANIYMHTEQPLDFKRAIKRTDFTSDKYTPFEVLGHMFASSTNDYPRESKILKVGEREAQQQFDDAAIGVAEQIKTVIDMANTEDAGRKDPTLEYIILNSF